VTIAYYRLGWHLSRQPWHVRYNSPAERKKLTHVLINENLSDVHLAASAFLCAARRVLLFQHEVEDQSLPRSASRGGTTHPRASPSQLCETSSPFGPLQDDPLGAQALHEMIRSIVRQHLGPQPQWYLTERFGGRSATRTSNVVLQPLEGSEYSTSLVMNVVKEIVELSIRSVRYH
jgi:hypothetical protein